MNQSCIRRRRANEDRAHAAVAADHVDTDATARHHRRARPRSAASGSGRPARPSRPRRSADPTSQSHRHDSFAAADLCHLAGLTEPQLAELESYGLLNGKGSGAATTYTACDLAIAQAAAGFMQHGVEGRHLKAWRQAAEREASLFEQMILPLLRQRNPQARQQAVDTLVDPRRARRRAALGDRCTLRSATISTADLRTDGRSPTIDGVRSRRDRDGVGRRACRGTRPTPQLSSCASSPSRIASCRS